jgi:hypothetical protein
MAASDFQVTGKNTKALFSLKLHRGDGMCLVAMNWKKGQLVIRDRRVAVSYAVEALRIFDHYHFRVVQKEAKKAKKTLELSKPPRKAGEKPWFADDYTNPRKIRDRELFS